MHQTTHEGVQLRAQRTIPEWGPDLIVRYFRQTGSGPSDNKFADVIAVNNLFPEEWSKLQRRERLTRLVETNLEIDGRYVVRIENKPKRTKSMYEKTKSLIVEPGQLVIPSRTLNNPPSFATAVVPPLHQVVSDRVLAAAPADGVSRAEFNELLALVRQLVPSAAPVAPPHAPANLPSHYPRPPAPAAPVAPDYFETLPPFVPDPQVDYIPGTTVARTSVRHLVALIGRVEARRAEILREMGREVPRMGPMRAVEFSSEDIEARLDRAVRETRLLLLEQGLEANDWGTPPNNAKINGIIAENWLDNLATALGMGNDAIETEGADQ